ncbi:MAG: cob(I)yrinic acid a,c-diamide adenosyltransferase [Acetomicrobium sp.]|uniref:Corrinoid adenosyltransferase n=1 Tax=Acetomicrobium thermoterrenum DSM 13490 TaxID=1120987 RepID=A0A1H3F7N7_9BACT|nr:cob(I)yrinic acid a,c-diamide adenosyltransferase [Acetomicrobium thermoterrenum]MBC7322745.1 cob(I)yrinic acid a,c-diamide adenosyltransferase [Acetomicrobium sp.]SDX86159.1 cob(I)alamin adenosyltransferase [Acetomicrobium thermoterrenum DSM 13490]
MEIKITTKTGDQGMTSLGNGERVPKDHPRVELYGTLDECQAHIGMARATCKNEEIKDTLLRLERDLSCFMGYLALFPDLSAPDVIWLEEIISKVLRSISKDKPSFVLPGESISEAALHIARTVARRAERIAVKLLRNKEIKENAYVFINRLSDALYALALWTNNDLQNREN